MPEPLDALQYELRDRYRFDEEISRTPMALVFRAHDHKHDRTVAIKALVTEFGGAESRGRFLREISVIARFQHPHILPLFDSGDAGDVLYYVMPFIEGETLRSRLKREGRLSVAEAVRLATGICDGLDYAHAHGVVHRDVKPENILLSDGHPLIADFGIARALDSVGHHSVTAFGIVMGTLSYMSPEQAGGEQHIDARTDIYSLGCVLFEMLVGETPFPTASPQSMLAQRISATPRSVRELRTDVPAGIARAVSRALSVDPRDRFASANEFAQDLARGLNEAVATQPEATTRRSFFALALAALAISATTFRLIGPPRAEAAGIAILPLMHVDSASDLTLDGDNCARLLYDAFSRWSGIALMNDMVVRDARTRHGGEVRTLDAATAIGHDLGARYVVWGEVVRAVRGVDVRATLFDIVGHVKEVRQQFLHVEPDESVEAAFATIADSLLLGILHRRVPPAAIAGTRDFDALLRYASAHAALDAWDLAAAESLFRAATFADTAYAAAQLELAQVIAWRDGSPDEWRAAAQRAKALSVQLGERQQRLSEALLAIADGEQQRACELYRTLIRGDSLDFDAWFGLGECQARDRAVVPDSTSPSGHRFRSSQHGAIQAYRRALELAPLFQRALTSTAYDRVAHLLYTEAGQIRMGLAVAPDTGGFASFPQLIGDSLGFVPYPIDWIYGLRPEAYPETHMDAIDRNRRLLRDLTRRWALGSPLDARAHETYAVALEGVGEIEGTPTQGAARSGALAEIAEARRLANDLTTRTRATAVQVRLLVKADRLADASRLTDSLLATTITARPGIAKYVAAAAALSGRTFAAARWAREAVNELVALQPIGEPALPVAPSREAAALAVFAANGNEVDSVRRLIGRVEAGLAAVASPTRRAKLRSTLLDWSVTLAYPALGVSAVHRKEAGGNVHMRIEWELAHGDTTAARSSERGLRALGDRERPGDAGFDAIALEAELLLATRDTTAASVLLDQTLAAISSSGRQLVEGLTESAGFGRALALRAQLARQRGDLQTARRWARAYADLYASAEGNSLRVRDAMRGIAAER